MLLELLLVRVLTEQPKEEGFLAKNAHSGELKHELLGVHRLLGKVVHPVEVYGLDVELNPGLQRLNFSDQLLLVQVLGQLNKYDSLVCGSLLLSKPLDSKPTASLPLSILLHDPEHLLDASLHKVFPRLSHCVAHISLQLNHVFERSQSRKHQPGPVILEHFFSFDAQSFLLEVVNFEAFKGQVFLKSFAAVHRLPEPLVQFRILGPFLDTDPRNDP